MAAHRRLIAVSVVTAALAATAGMAFAADSATASRSPMAAAGGQTVGKPASGGSKSGADQRSAALSAIAGDLGVSVDRLESGLRASKVWVGTQSNPSEDSFAAHLASILGLPAGRVQSALEAHGFVIGAGGGNKAVAPPAKQGGRTVDLAKIAADLQVSAAQVQDALAQTKQWIATSGAAPTPQAFAAHVASILGKPANAVLQVLERDGALA